MCSDETQLLQPAGARPTCVPFSLTAHSTARWELRAEPQGLAFLFPCQLWWGCREVRSERCRGAVSHCSVPTVWEENGLGCGGRGQLRDAGPAVRAGTQRHCWARAGPLLGVGAGAAVLPPPCVRFKISLTGHVALRVNDISLPERYY